ncbi:hypothetical protein QWY82_15775 [Simiduia curdlanivorans]|uniref:Uncharacterized protein n=1 Tax=Simiduia curdlanivorans TaxID=1492769 RepID=A0ABV8V661_9GAMM|nr:hypothetical protein [Simiduia curdlanivorans]MDN3640255.1 hypothetical protein [Simiduia curdlanivorans]
MSYGLLNLNDHCIELFEGERCALKTSAHVLFQPRDIITGDSAQAQIRINPTLAYSKHWLQLDQAQRKLPNPNFRHHADIAYFQLGQWLEGFQQKPLLVATSYNYSTEQYALLAGLLQAHNQTPLGFCDSGLLQASGYIALEQSADTLLYFVDFSLHSARLLAFHRQQHQLVLAQQWDFPNAGIIELQNAWLKVIAQTCIKQTRYDPLHSASSEQRLYAQLAASFQSLARADAVELDIDGKKIELQKIDLLPLTDSFRQAIAAQIGAAPLLLSQSAQIYSGLSGINLSGQHLQSAVLAHEDFFKQQTSLQHHSHLPMAGAHDIPSAALNKSDRNARSEVQVSHLLDQHLAHPLAAPAYLYQQGEKLSLTTQNVSPENCAAELVKTAQGWEIRPTATGVTLNNAVLTRPVALQLGDKIGSPNHHYHFTCIGLVGANNGA